LRNDERFWIDDAAAVNRATSWSYPIAHSMRRRVDLQCGADMMVFDVHLHNGCLACRNAEESHAENDVKRAYRGHVVLPPVL
jgi:hypothetical protein